MSGNPVAPGLGGVVLVADDNAVIRGQLGNVLTSAGYRVVAVADGVAAVEALSRETFDLALLDVDMPRLGGIEVAMNLRDSGRHPALVGLIAAGSADAARCGEAGMVDTLVKPIKPAALLEAVRRWTAEGALPPVDLGHLARQTANDVALRDELLTLFVDGTAAYLARLARPADDRDWREAAHALKGSARGIGAGAIATLAERAERETDAARRQMLLAQLNTAFAAARQFIADLTPPR